MSIVYREGHHIDFEQLAAVFASVGWKARAADRARLRQQLIGAMFVESAWDNEALVGFARAISDGASLHIEDPPTSQLGGTALPIEHRLAGSIW